MPFVSDKQRRWFYSGKHVGESPDAFKKRLQLAHTFGMDADDIAQDQESQRSERAASGADSESLRRSLRKDRDQ